MNKSNRHPLREKPTLFLLFIVASLLLHLLAGYLFLNRSIIPEPESKQQQTPVALREQKNWLELDQKPEKSSETPPEKARHLAESNQKVRQESAPKGDDSRDQTASVSQQPSAQKPPQQRHEKQVSKTEPKAPVQKNLPNLPPDEIATHSPTKEPRPETPDIPLTLPKLSDLTNLSPSTLARLDRQQRKRVKDRPEIELKDDEIWLNLQEMDNKLLSFFKRFHDRIEAVWNYPVEASSRGVQGTLLIKIVINKKGELLDALPLESSGSDILDYEAIQAVYRAAPFGALPSYYPHQQLKIYAHFQYNLSRRSIYGRP